MKNLYTLIVVIFLAFTAQAQEVVVYEQNFAATPANITTTTWETDNLYSNGTTGGAYYRTKTAPTQAL